MVSITYQSNEPAVRKKRVVNTYFLVIYELMVHILIMAQTVNLVLLQGWIDRHGIAELERRSGVSVHTIMRIKNKSRPSVPKRPRTRLKLAEAIGVSEADLFPLATNRGKAKAS